jgi:uncharacterized protein
MNPSSSIMTWGGWVVAAALLFWLMSWGASRMIYYPMRYPDGDWSVQQALSAQDVSLTASDGTKLHAWWVPASDSKIATLHLHGNAGNITHRGLTARNIVAAGSGVLLLDYRGYGKSEGRPTERGFYQDAEAAYGYLIAHGYSAARIFIHGESLGTAVAAHLAESRGPAGLVLEAPFTSASAVAGRVVPVLGPLLVRGYDTLSRIGRVRVPVLIVHGDRDEVIPYGFGKQLYDAANAPKSLWTVRGAMHNDLHVVGRAEFRDRLSAFYASCLK